MVFLPQKSTKFFLFLPLFILACNTAPPPPSGNYDNTTVKPKGGDLEEPGNAGVDETGVDEETTGGTVVNKKTKTITPSDDIKWETQNPGANTSSGTNTGTTGGNTITTPTATTKASLVPLPPNTPGKTVEECNNAGLVWKPSSSSSTSIVGECGEELLTNVVCTDEQFRKVYTVDTNNTVAVEFLKIYGDYTLYNCGRDKGVSTYHFYKGVPNGLNYAIFRAG
ncbi:MAG: hypothetical protein HQK54_15565 [Oligoflexales bacterium]|nr:hypothetical protein [Oligoflexales bacterium]